MGTGGFAPLVNNLDGTSWTITVTGSSTFQINNGSTTGAYSSGGTAVDNSLLAPFDIPSNGDSFVVASVNVALMALADRTQTLAAFIARSQTKTFDADNTFVVPPGCQFMLAQLVGGGGGGEGGKRGEHGATTAIYPQGGGGAASPCVFKALNVTPGDTLTLSVGAGGPGGAAGGGAGGDGGPTLVTNGLGNLIGLANGGAGCGCGIENWSGAFSPAASAITPPGAYTDSVAAVAPGAQGVNVVRHKPAPFSLGANLYGFLANNASAANSHVASFVPEFPCSGGYVAAVGSLQLAAAGAFPEASENQTGSLQTTGGTAGTAGTLSGAYYGGCAGGGGGGSVVGIGGNGGNGGNGNNSGAGGNATAGTAGTLGAGGGGGGCGGDGSASGGSSAAGGAGGSGRIILYWISNYGGA